MSTRSLPHAIARLSSCRSALARRIPHDETEAEVLRALELQYHDWLVLLSGVDTLGSISEFQEAVEAALSSPDPILEPTRSDIERRAAQREAEEDARKEMP